MRWCNIGILQQSFLIKYNDPPLFLKSWTIATDNLATQGTLVSAAMVGHTKSQNLNVSRLVLQLSLRNLLKPGVQSRMKMYLEQRLQAMLQLYLSDQQFYYILRCVSCIRDLMVVLSEYPLLQGGFNIMTSSNVCNLSTERACSVLSTAPIQSVFQSNWDWYFQNGGNDIDGWVFCHCIAFRSSITLRDTRHYVLRFWGDIARIKGWLRVMTVCCAHKY